MSSLIRVFAFVGPRPVRSCSSLTVAVEIMSERAFASGESPLKSIWAPSVRFLGGCVHHERERKRWSPDGSLGQAYSLRRSARAERRGFSERSVCTRLLVALARAPGVGDTGALPTGLAPTCHGGEQDRKRGAANERDPAKAGFVQLPGHALGADQGG